MFALVCDGIGIACMPLFTGNREASGLKILLEDYKQPEYGVYAVYPQRQYLIIKVRVFVVYLVEPFSK